MTDNSPGYTVDRLAEFVVNAADVVVLRGQFY